MGICCQVLGIWKLDLSFRVQGFEFSGFGRGVAGFQVGYRSPSHK